MTHAKDIAKFGGLLIWAYARHLFTFSVGAALGAATGMSVTTLMFLALLKSRGLL
jgi:low affinity Fe/Cu permease